MTVEDHDGVQIIVFTFGRQPTEGPQQLSEIKVVLASHSPCFFTTEDGHHRNKGVLDEFLHRLNTLGHVGTPSSLLQFISGFFFFKTVQPLFPHGRHVDLVEQLPV